jgi:hypothetical protein
MDTLDDLYNSYPYSFTTPIIIDNINTLHFNSIERLYNYILEHYSHIDKQMTPLVDLENGETDIIFNTRDYNIYCKLNKFKGLSNFNLHDTTLIHITGEILDDYISLNKNVYVLIFENGNLKIFNNFYKVSSTINNIDDYIISIKEYSNSLLHDINILLVFNDNNIQVFNYTPLVKSCKINIK